jgi:hypothetical protein
MSALPESGDSTRLKNVHSRRQLLANAGDAAGPCGVSALPRKAVKPLAIMLCADRVPIVSAHFRSAMTQTGSPDPRIDLVCITSSCPRQFLQNFGTPSSLPGLTSLNRSGLTAFLGYVRFTPESGHPTRRSACPLSAISGSMHRSKRHARAYDGRRCDCDEGSSRPRMEPGDWSAPLIVDSFRRRF